MNAETFLNQFINLEKTRQFSYPLKLERMRGLLELCGEPQKAGFGVVTVAGSKGKGSTAAMIASVLRAAGLRTGLYTSPHLVSWTERIQLDGGPVTEEEGAALASFIEDCLKGADFPHGRPTYFEALTPMALLHFARRGAAAVVLEVGLGGQFDATNACEPDVSVITPIGLEHQDVLGPTLTRIAQAKCGILRAGKPAVPAVQKSEPMEAIAREAARLGVPLRRVGRDVRFTAGPWDESAQEFRIEAPAKDGPFKVPLLGRHQLENAVCAYLAARTFCEARRVPLPSAAVREGLRSVRWPGRLEKLSLHPLTLADGAHTQESAEALSNAVRRHFKFGRLHLIAGMMGDKDARRFLEPFRGLPDTFWAVRLNHERAMAPQTLLAEAGALGFRCREGGTLAEMLARLSAERGDRDLTLITGSLYLVGQAKEFFEHALQHG